MAEPKTPEDIRPLLKSLRWEIES